MKRIPLHIQIVIGLVLGLVYALVSIYAGFSPAFTLNWIKPIGDIFVNGLQMIAVPLVLASLIVGVANLGDISKLSRIGGKTIGIYLLTTTIAVTIGLVTVNVLKPGSFLTPETRDSIVQRYENDFNAKVSSSEQNLKKVKESGPLQPLVDMVPKNVVGAAADNKGMLQVVFFALLVGVALLRIPREKGETVLRFFDGLNDVIIKIVEFIMIIAPYAVFALVASLLVDIAGDNPQVAMEILGALGYYAITVIIGLLAMILIVYPILFKLFTKVKYINFFKGIRPAQLLAFSTSSSSATLPVTMRQVEEELGVSEEVSSFVLPLGATINMDGTSLYQGVAAVFIAQAFGYDLTLSQQLTIVLTATLASIGSAGVPGAGLIMLIIVLEAIGMPAAGIALILAPDRLLDMCRTVVNVTGDASVAMVVASTEGETPGAPKEEDVEDILVA